MTLFSSSSSSSFQPVHFSHLISSINSGNDSDPEYLSSNASQHTGTTDTSGSMSLNDSSLPRPNHHWPATLKDIHSALLDESERDVDGSLSNRGEKEKRVEKKKKGISSGFRSSVFPSKISDPVTTPYSLDSPVLDNEKKRKDSTCDTCDVDSCFDFADSWLGPVLSSMRYEESDGILTDGCQEG